MKPQDFAAPHSRVQSEQDRQIHVAAFERPQKTDDLLLAQYFGLGALDPGRSDRIGDVPRDETPQKSLLQGFVKDAVRVHDRLRESRPLPSRRPSLSSLA